jgi:hypothetical protein
LVCRNGRLENSWELEELKTFDYNPPAIKSFTKTDTILENTKTPAIKAFGSDQNFFGSWNINLFIGLLI